MNLGEARDMLKDMTGKLEDMKAPEINYAERLFKIKQLEYKRDELEYKFHSMTENEELYTVDEVTEISLEKLKTDMALSKLLED